MFEADHLAALGSDLLLAAGKPDAGTEGYVVVPREKRVVFLGTRDSAVVRYAMVDVGSRSVRRVDGEPASEVETAMFRALRGAMAEFKPPCERAYNPIVVEDPDAPNWIVYFLASTTDPGEVMVGGHVRAVVSKADGKLIELTPLSATCFVTRTDRAPKGSKTAGVFLNHPKGPIPAETHVYLNLLHRLSMFVQGNDGSSWTVENGLIRAMK